MAQQVTVGSTEIELSNVDKVFFPADGITKGELVGYYRRLAPRLLPHLRGRPLAMVRLPDGLDGESFLQKEVPDYFPGWVRRVPVPKRDGVLEQVVCDHAATLVYLADKACVEPHVFLSHADRLDYPDQMVFDLDPPDVDRFGSAREAALASRALLEDELGVTTLVKTTGGKGLHVHVPLDRRNSFDEVRELAHRAARLLSERDPRRLTTEQRRERRGDRVFIDTLRNAYAQTVVAPYAVRAKPGAPVSTPLSWKEVESPVLDPRRLDMGTVESRLQDTQDPWSGFGRRRYGTAKLDRGLSRLGA